MGVGGRWWSGPGVEGGGSWRLCVCGVSLSVGSLGAGDGCCNQAGVQEVLSERAMPVAWTMLLTGMTWSITTEQRVSVIEHSATVRNRPCARSLDAARSSGLLSRMLLSRIPTDLAWAWSCRYGVVALSTLSAMSRVRPEGLEG